MILVFDLGATQTRIALSTDGVHLKKPYVFSTDPSANGPKHFVAEIIQFIGEAKIDFIAGGIAGTIDRNKNILLESPNLPEWKRIPLGDLLSSALHADVILENDTAVVGLGEVLAYQNQGIIAYVTVSTGVNAACFVNGQIEPSTYGFEAGRILIPSAKGEQKSLETLIGGKAMQLRYGRLPREIEDPKVWDLEAQYLAEGLYNMMLIWSPEAFILGGSMMRDIPLPLIQSKLEALPAVFPELPRLVPAQLGAFGGLYGALELLRQYRARTKVGQKSSR